MGIYKVLEQWSLPRPSLPPVVDNTIGGELQAQDLED